MSSKRFITVILMGGTLAAIVWQRSVLAGLRSQNEALRAAREETDRLELENSGSRNSATIAANPAPEAGANPELLRLRNEVRRLRAQKLDWDRLKNQNEQLAAEIRSGLASPVKFSDLEGFVAKESWSHAGFGTPEAAVQTFFWAAREGDLARVAECFPAKDGQYLAALTQPGHEQERDRMLDDLRQMTMSAGFRIMEKVTQEEGFSTAGGRPVGGEPQLPTKVLLRIQAVGGGSVIPLSLWLYPDGWKIKDL
jgi:hypothetical protein